MSPHVPVLLEAAMAQLALGSGDDAIDCTLGGGGHTRAMLAATAPNGRVLAIDRDADAVVRARESAWGRAAVGRLILMHEDFRNIASAAREHGIGNARGIIADLGLSSLQLAAANRGFSFRQDAPLDMRFSASGGSASGGDPTDGETAAEILRTRSERELEHMFRTYGEEPAARAIARAIVAERRRTPIRTTAALVAIIERVARRRGHLHPATRVFQALRIAVNDELGALEALLAQIPNVLTIGGRAVIISFHSLEDRAVKRWFRRCAVEGACTLLVRRPMRPSPGEIARNPRSRSAKLRAIQRIA